MRVLVGCPTSEHKAYCLEEYAKRVSQISFSDFSFLIVDNSQTNEYYQRLQHIFHILLGLDNQKFLVLKDKYSKHAKDRIVHSRNIIREHAIKEGFDYFLSVEQDVLIKSDIVTRLIQHSRDIVSALVFNHANKNGRIIQVPMLYIEKDTGKKHYVHPSKIMSGQLIEVDACSLSCVLISTKVLQQIVFRYEKGFDDMMFCSDAKQQGFQIYADTSIVPEHIPKSWAGIIK